MARRSGVAGAVAGAAETVPRLPAPAAVLAVVGHAPAEGGRVNAQANLWGDACTYVRGNQTEVTANRSLSLNLVTLIRGGGRDYRRSASCMWESVEHRIEPPQDSNTAVLCYFINIF